MSWEELKRRIDEALAEQAEPPAPTSTCNLDGTCKGCVLTRSECRRAL